MNWPHEVDSKVPQLRPQLPNLEIGNFKLRLQVAGVEAKLRHELRPSWRSLKNPIEIGVLDTPPHIPSGSEWNPSGMVGMVGIW